MKTILIFEVGVNHDDKLKKGLNYLTLLNQRETHLKTSSSYRGRPPR